MKSLCNTAASLYLSVLHLVTYIFQCHSLKLSSSLLSLLCPQVHSVHVHLYPCLAKRFISNIFVDSIPVQSVQPLSCVRLFVTPWITATQASLSITNSQSLLKPMSIEAVMPSSHLIFCHPLLHLPQIPHFIRVLSNESILCMRWPKYWSFSFSISPSNEHLGLISFRMDWLGLFAVQGTLKSFLQHHSSKISILWHSSFFTVQISQIHDHWKIHSLN